MLTDFIGISKFCHSSPMLEALKINQISTLIDASSLDLLRSHLNSTSKGKHFVCLHVYVEITSMWKTQ